MKFAFGDKVYPTVLEDGGVPFSQEEIQDLKNMYGVVIHFYMGESYNELQYIVEWRDARTKLPTRHRPPVMSWRNYEQNLTTDRDEYLRAIEEAIDCEYLDEEDIDDFIDEDDLKD